MRTIYIDGIYTHFKGSRYIVLNVGEHTETGERMIIYRGLGDNKVYVRPYDSFVSYVDIVKYPDVEQEYRFELLK